MSDTPTMTFDFNEKDLRGTQEEQPPEGWYPARVVKIQPEKRSWELKKDKSPPELVGMHQEVVGFVCRLLNLPEVPEDLVAQYDSLDMNVAFADTAFVDFPMSLIRLNEDDEVVERIDDTRPSFVDFKTPNCKMTAQQWARMGVPHTTTPATDPKTGAPTGENTVSFQLEPFVGEIIMLKIGKPRISGEGKKFMNVLETLGRKQYELTSGPIEGID